MGGELGIFLFPEYSYRKKAVYDDSHLASLVASVFQIAEPEPVHGVKLGIYRSVRAFI